MNDTNLPASGPEGTIPVADAKRMTANWKIYLAKSGQAFSTIAFLVPIISFKNILLYNPDAEGVRAYFGLEDAADPKSGKLILVPVVNGHDVPYLPGSDKGYGANGEDTSNTYDLTRPCPPECDADSIIKP